MQAVVYSRYGPPEVLHLADIDPPTVGHGDVLIRVHATTVCAGDVRFRKADPFFLRALNGWTAPRKTTVLGMEFAGTVAALGAGVTRFALGDRVFGSTGLRFGAYADYVCVADGKMVEHMPAAARFEDAAAIPYGGVSALFFLRQAKVAAGQEVLVYGASGNVGVFAVQLAKHWGARVTAVCSARNAALVTSLGADAVIDYPSRRACDSDNVPSGFPRTSATLNSCSVALRSGNSRCAPACPRCFSGYRSLATTSVGFSSFSTSRMNDGGNEAKDGSSAGTFPVNESSAAAQSAFAYWI
jgi:NADPH:quinone reductase-like Zn-dependent oxidoreductase